MYSKIYLRLEPLGLELVAAAAQRAGHSVRLIDLQCESHRDFFRALQRWQPDVIAFCGNYLANVGRFDESLTEFKRAQELEPLSLIICLNLAVPGTCMNEPVVNSNQEQLTMGGCLGLLGFESAKEFWEHHPLYHTWKFKGWACQFGNRAPPDRGKA